MECKKVAGREKDANAQIRPWFQPEEGLYIQIHPSDATEPECQHAIGQNVGF